MNSVNHSRLCLGPEFTICPSRIQSITSTDVFMYLCKIHVHVIYCFNQQENSSQKYLIENGKLWNTQYLTLPLPTQLQFSNYIYFQLRALTHAVLVSVWANSRKACHQQFQTNRRSSKKPTVARTYGYEENFTRKINCRRSLLLTVLLSPNQKIVKITYLLVCIVIRNQIQVTKFSITTSFRNHLFSITMHSVMWEMLTISNSPT